jgi:plastocyanin
MVTIASAAPAGAVVAVAGPVSEETGFATPAIVVPAGQGLTLVNADPASYNHNLVAAQKFFSSTARKPHWCAGYPKTRCPVFWSQIIAAGGVTPVEGVPVLKAGQYKFECTLHALMTGTLVVQ